MNQIERMKWACRRGMLELDLFLIRFFDDCYESLSYQDKAAFGAMLTYSDPELLAWLLHNDAPPEQLDRIVKAIRAHATQKHSA